MDKDIRMQQHDEIGESKIFESKSSANAKECMYEGYEENKNGEDRNETVIANEWLTPKKDVTIKHVCEMQGMNEDKNMNNNKYKELTCDKEKDEDEECHTMVKDIKSSTGATNDTNHEKKSI